MSVHPSLKLQSHAPCPMGNELLLELLCLWVESKSLDQLKYVSSLDEEHLLPIAKITEQPHSPQRNVMLQWNLDWGISAIYRPHMQLQYTFSTGNCWTRCNASSTPSLGFTGDVGIADKSKTRRKPPFCSKPGKCLWDEVKALVPTLQRCTFSSRDRDSIHHLTHREFLCKKHLHGSSNITGRIGRCKCPAPSSNTAQDHSRTFLWLTAAWQHPVKHGRRRTDKVENDSSAPHR